MAYLRPGVYVEETTQSNAPVSGVNSDSTATFVGYSLRGPVVPTLINSWTDYTTLYGTWDTNPANNNLTAAVYLFFENGGSQCYVQRVAGTSSVSATRTLNDSPVATVTAASSNGTVFTYIANNNFTTGQYVTIAGVATGFNVTNQQVTSATATQFTIANTTTVTAVTGVTGTATAVVSGVSVTAGATLVVTAINPGAWGNNLSVGISPSTLGNSYFNLTVYLTVNGTTNIAERFTDLTMNTADAAYALPYINGVSSYITITDSNASDTFQSYDNPASTVVNGVDTPNSLTTGADGTAPAYSAIVSSITGGSLENIHTPLILNVPGLTGSVSGSVASATDVNTLLTYVVASRPGIFVVLDGAMTTPGTVTAASETVANQLLLAAAYTTTSQAAVYYPSLVLPHPTSKAPGATITAFNGGAVIGKFISTDASRGVFKSPAGLDARISGAVSVPLLKNSELDSLNSATKPVNAIRYIPGSGIVVMGARTLDPSYAGRYVSVRRSLIYLRKSLADLSNFAVFEPNNELLWDRLSSTVQNFLTTFWNQGGLRGDTPSAAFYVKCDSDNNTALTVQNGQVVLEVGVALQRPAEFVVIRISQFDSGAVVTVS